MSAPGPGPGIGNGGFPGGGGNVSTSGSITSGQTAQWNGATTLISVANTGTGNYVLATSPTFTGTPAAPTPAAGDNSTTIPTTAFVAALTVSSKSAAYTLVITDINSLIYHPSADTTARTWTIPANSSVAFPVGTVISFFNDTSAGTVTVAITSDTLVQANAGTTGSISLLAGHSMSIVKVTSTRWVANLN